MYELTSLTTLYLRFNRIVYVDSAISNLRVSLSVFCTGIKCLHGANDMVIASLHGASDMVIESLHGASDMVIESLHGACDMVIESLHGAELVIW